MRFQILYTDWDKENQCYVFSSEQKEDKNCDFITYRLVADAGKYLYNTESGQVKKAITIPFFLKDEWEERAY